MTRDNEKVAARFAVWVTASSDEEIDRVAQAIGAMRDDENGVRVSVSETYRELEVEP